MVAQPIGDFLDVGADEKVFRTGETQLACKKARRHANGVCKTTVNPMCLMPRSLAICGIARPSGEQLFGPMDLGRRRTVLGRSQAERCTRQLCHGGAGSNSTCGRLGAKLNSGDTFGIGGSFTEYYAMDFKDDVVLMGHDGPGHIAIAAGKTKVRPLRVYHGKVGKGLSVEMSVKHELVTLLSVVEDRGGSLFLLVAEGESVPGQILEIGNTNSRYRFSIGARAFVNDWNAHGPAHHCAIAVGHISSKLEKLAKSLDVRMVKVC